MNKIPADVVEAVARAICEKYYGIIADSEFSQHPTKLAWENYTGEAQAAITALIEKGWKAEAPVEWAYCPECGCESFERGIWREGNKEHICTECSQSWFDDINYSDTVHGNLRRMALTARPLPPQTAQVKRDGEGGE